MMGTKSEGPMRGWAGAAPRNGHYGHGHGTFRRAMATNGFGHRTFLHYILFTQTFIIAVFCVNMKTSDKQCTTSYTDSLAAHYHQSQ